MANASVVIKGYNQMTKAVNGAVQDIGKIKTAADKASKTLRNVFELGTTVAVLKKVVKLSKEYMSNMTDPKVLESYDSLKSTLSEIKKTFSGTANTLLPSMFSNINNLIQGASTNIQNIIMYVGASIKNLPSLIEPAIALIGDMIQTIWSWDFLSGTVKLFFNNLATLVVGIFNAIEHAFGGVLKWSYYTIESDFWTLLANIEDAFENMIENVVNSAISALNKLPLVNIDPVQISIGNGKYRENSRKAYSNSLQAQEDTDVIKAINTVVDSLKTVTVDTTSFLKNMFGSDIKKFTSSVSTIIAPTIEEIKYKVSTIENNTSENSIDSKYSFTSLKDRKSNAMDEVIDSVIEIMAEFAVSVSPLVIGFQLIGTAVQSFFTVLNNGISTVLQPLFDAMSWIGLSLAQVFMPILDAIYPIMNLIANMLQTVIAPILQLLSPIIQAVAFVFQLLTPIIVLVGKGLTVLMAPIQWLGDLFSWCGAWVQYFGSCIGIAIYNVLHPFRQKSFGTSPGSFSSDAFSGLSNRLAQWDNIGSTTSGLTNGTSTSSAISSAAYNGATNVTINIYQQAPVVGDSGMRQFANMIRNEFAKLDYYGVTA